MTRLEYWRLRRKLKYDLHRNKTHNLIRVQDEAAVAQIRELNRQARCSHDFSHELTEKKIHDGIGTSVTHKLILICRHCGKVEII